MNHTSLGISRIAGYSLFLMNFINWADIALPPQLLNPTWELEAVGAIVESVPLLFLSLVLIFYGESLYRKKLEKLLVRLLSSICLPIALCFFLMVPVATNSTIRINQQIDTQTGEIFGEQMEQIDQLESQLGEASNAEIVSILESQGIEIQSEQSLTPQDQLLEYLAEARETIRNQTNNSRENRKRSTIKSAVKWMLGAVISGFALVYLWRISRWARVRQPIANGAKNKS